MSTDYLPELEQLHMATFHATVPTFLRAEVARDCKWCALFAEIHELRATRTIDTTATVIAGELGSGSSMSG